MTEPIAPEPSAVQGQGASQQQDEPPSGGEQTLTQAEVDRIVGERLARERSKYADYDDLKAKAAKHDEAVQAQKTEQERLSEQLTAAQTEAKNARGEAMRLKVATAKSLPTELAARLRGDTEEELAADADTLLAVFPQPQQPAPGQRTPVEHLRPGALPNPPEPSLGDQIAAAEKAGDWTQARQLKTQQLMKLAEQTK